ncbi:MAG: hemolysin family protein, partial [Muribaculaceae bacterium]|nr:hemolysin family protein [Muribaculaceae bacterium]
MNDIVIILLLILLNGIFSMSEIALISARKSRLTNDAKRGSAGAAAAIRLSEDPDRFLSTIQIGITLIGILTGLYSGAALADDLGNALLQWGLRPNIAHNIAQISIVIAVTYLSIVVGELVPKRIGLTMADSVAKIVSRPMRLLSVIAMPAVWLLSRSTALIVKIAGLEHKDNGVTEEEIKSLIQDGTDSGEVRKVEQDIMERALVLGDRRVSSIMTPKIDVVALRLSMSANEIKQHISDELHDSYPVYCDIDSKDICGIVSLKNLIFAIDSPEFSLRQVVKEATYFPESMSAYDALDHLKSKHIHCALVCDEFGDLAGVITLSDIHVSYTHL